NHVAISVPSCDEAATWYETIFGFRRICRDATTTRSSTPSAPIFKIYGDKLQEVKCVWLSCGNGVGFEIFEFVEPGYVAPAKTFEYNRGGFFHIAVTVPDPDAIAKKIAETRGKQIGETVEVNGEKALYVHDPWGNVIECLSCSYEHL
ncbi:Glyoxalase/Bleomycin resistance protein/Dihydroxybiphenyl dioxygenase, partial [Aulographum hederae CBS 113979]